MASYLDEQSAHPFFRERKRATLHALGLVPGARALDVGCGLGDDVRAFSMIVGAEGLAAGVDSSQTLVDEARRRASGLVNVEFHVADATRLPFGDGSFDAVRIERTLQHLPDPAVAVAEMARVAKVGARVAAFEPDWGTLRIEAGPAEVTEAVCRRWRAGILQPRIGRRLIRLFGAAGLVVEQAEEHTVTIDDLSFAERQFELSRLAAAEGPADWFTQLGRLDAAGRFRARTTYISVLARH